ncbi:MAG: TIR domain-containing protein [Nitrospira sp.]|nr:TIR domain-containing protein [Nitrospira sp.]
MNSKDHYTYNAFISYSHSPDGQVAPAIQSALHRFARPWYRMRALRIFRDQTNLSVSPALWPTIEQALGQSEFFILLASPRAASSKWVAKEIDFWMTFRSIDSLLLVITDGDIKWDEVRQDFDWRVTSCLPQGLVGRFKEEPHYLDFRWVKTATQLSLKNPQFLNHIADLAATLHRRSKDQMIGEDVRQHRRTRQMSSTAIISLLSLTVFSFYQRSQAVTQRTIAVGRQLAAQSELLRRQQGRLIERSALLAIEAMKRHPSMEADQALRAALTLLPSSSSGFVHPDKVMAVALPGDGNHIVTAGYDGTLRSWQREGHRHLWTISSVSPVLSLAASPDGRLIAASLQEGSVRLIDPKTGQELTRLKHERQINLTMFSPDGKYLLTCGTDAVGHLWSIEQKELIASLHHEGKVLALGFAADNSVAITGSLDGTARMWTVPEGREVRRVSTGSPVVNVALAPDRRHLVTVGREAILTVWDTAKEGERIALTMHAPAELLRFSPDGSMLAAAGEKLVQLWETVGWQQTDRLIHEDMITALVFNPTGGVLSTASLDGTARVWDSTTGSELMRVAHGDPVQEIAYSADGQRLATASHDGVARLVESHREGQGFHSIDVGFSPSCLAISREGAILAIGGSDGTVMLWDMREQQRRWTFKLKEVINDLAFSPNSKYLSVVPRSGPVKIMRVDDSGEVAAIGQKPATVASFSLDGRDLAVGRVDHTTVLYRTDTWSEGQSFRHRDIVLTLAFSPDGRFLLTGTGSFSAKPANEATILNLRKNEQMGVVSHADPVGAATFSADGRFFATGSQDSSATVWETTSRRQVAQMQHEQPVRAVQFSKDGRQLFTGSEDRTLRIWEVETSEELSRVVHDSPVKDVVMTPDGNTVMTATGDGNVWFSPWRPDDLIEAMCQRLTRNLTQEEWKQYLPNEPYRKTCPNFPGPEDKSR